MSSPPSNSQSPAPLNNFSFPKWSTSHHRGRRGESSSSSHQSPAPNPAVNTTAQRPSTLRVLVGGKPLLQPHNVSDRVVENVYAVKELRERPQSSKHLRPRIQTKPIEVPPEEEKRGDVSEEMEVEEDDQKTWNLRPRKPQNKLSTSLLDDKSELPQTAEDNGGSKESPPRWPKFSLSLTPQEIEEDIVTMTGSMPSRKPKKRPKAVQKKLDNMTPGMWLESLTPDAYKVPETSKKKKR
ncbi:hypothetical protein LguiA_019276 [Lonicera macranthoides]